jgi:hypothetical protein
MPNEESLPAGRGRAGSTKLVDEIRSAIYQNDDVVHVETRQNVAPSAAAPGSSFAAITTGGATARIRFPERSV